MYRISLDIWKASLGHECSFSTFRPICLLLILQININEKINIWFRFSGFVCEFKKWKRWGKHKDLLKLHICLVYVLFIPLVLPFAVGGNRTPRLVNATKQFVSGVQWKQRFIHSYYYVFIVSTSSFKKCAIPTKRNCHFMKCLVIILCSQPTALVRSMFVG